MIVYLLRNPYCNIYMKSFSAVRNHDGLGVLLYYCVTAEVILL